MAMPSEIKLALFQFKRKLGLPRYATFHVYRLNDLAAAGQNLRLADIGQRRFVIADLAFQQGQPAHTTIAAAALVFHIVSGAFQAVQQRFPFKQVKVKVGGGDTAHSSNPLRSSADTSESIWPTR